MSILFSLSERERAAYNASIGSGWIGARRAKFRRRIAGRRRKSSCVALTRHG
jgi:hypothetical protein